MLLKLLFDFLNHKMCFAAENEGGAGTATDTEENPVDAEEEPTDDGGEPEETITIKGVEYKASELVGKDGIPRIKNLQAEIEKKDLKLKDAQDLIKGIVQQPAQVQQVDPQKQFNNIIEAVKSKYPNVDEETARMAVEISQGMVQAQAIARAPVDAEYFVDRAKSSILRAPKEADDDGLSDRSVLEAWEDEVNEALTAMPVAWKSNPQTSKQAVENAISFVAGKHRRDILADAKKGLDSRGGIRPRDTSVVSSGGSKVPKSAGNHGAGLTDAQKTDQQRMGNISESDYRVTLKKAQERDKVAGRPIRQTLN